MNDKSILIASSPRTYSFQLESVSAYCVQCPVPHDPFGSQRSELLEIKEIVYPTVVQMRLDDSYLSNLYCSIQNIDGNIREVHFSKILLKQ